MKMDELTNLGRRYTRYYAGRVARDLCEKKKVVPDFEVGTDRAAWTGPVNGREKIHVGLGLFTDFPDGTPICETEEDFHVWMRHISGHECGHQKYTTSRAFVKAQTNGYHGFVDYAVKQITGKPMRLVKDDDYDKAVALLAKQYNIHFNAQMLKHFIHFIANSIEDGRMERLVSNEKKGFKMDTRYCRALEWSHSPVDPKTVDLTDSRKKLMAVLNQVLSLSTTGLYQKGYMTHYANTALETEIRKLYPDIRAGVMARSCSKGMQHAENIMRDLYPLLLEACKLTDFEQMLSQFMQSLASALPGLLNDNEETSAGGRSEKEDAEAAEEDAQAASGNGDGDTEGEGGFNIFLDTEGKESSNSGSAKGTAGDEDQHGQNGDTDQENPSGDVNASNSEASAQNSATTSSAGGQSGSKGQSIQAGAGDDSEQVLQAMKDAAAAVKEQTETAEHSVTAQEALEAQKQETFDTSTAVSNAGSMEDICDDLHEFTREYELTYDLPLFIQQECDITRREYEKYFVSRRKPRRRNQKAGALDAHQLSRLVRGDTDVYTRPGNDNSFSGCIEILLDNSGSMSGEKKQFACEALARIEENLKGLVPLKIVAFDSGYMTNVEIIKNWNESRRKNCTWNYLVQSRDGGGTPTTEILSIAEREMLARTERHKLIILLTDENARCSGERLPSIIRDIRSKHINLCGIYFETRMTANDQQMFYDLFENKDAIACNASEISKELLPVIKRFTEL